MSRAAARRMAGLLAVLVAALLQTASAPKTSAAPKTLAAPKDDAASRFDAQVDAFLRGYYAFRPVEGTLSGYHAFDDSLPARSAEPVKGEIARLKEALVVFSGLSPSSLDTARLADRDILVNRIKSEIIEMES